MSQAHVLCGTATFTDLQPGRYVLECATEDGRRCTKSIEVLAHETGADAPNQEFRIVLPAK